MLLFGTVKLNNLASRRDKLHVQCQAQSIFSTFIRKYLQLFSERKERALYLLACEQVVVTDGPHHHYGDGISSIDNLLSCGSLDEV